MRNANLLLLQEVAALHELIDALNTELDSKYAAQR